MRLDQYLHGEGLAESREKARALIMAGQVYVSGEKVTKAGFAVGEDAQVELRGEALPYVSRGGLKLEKALSVFGVSPAGKVCMDVGASTGGFTDCMLQNDAAKVYAVDVGYGQLAWRLRNDPRVIVLERTNIRHLTPEQVPDSIDFFSVDVSFISLKLVLPAVAALTGEKAEGVCLVKPQFEAGKGKVGKNGVVRDSDTRIETILNCAGYANQNGFSVEGVDYSPIKGPKGNVEFLLQLLKEDNPKPLTDADARKACEQAETALG